MNHALQMSCSSLHSLEDLLLMTTDFLEFSLAPLKLWRRFRSPDDLQNEVLCCILHYHHILYASLAWDSFFDSPSADCGHLCNFKFIFCNTKGRVQCIVLSPTLVCDVWLFFICFLLSALIFKHTVRSRIVVHTRCVWVDVLGSGSIRSTSQWARGWVLDLDTLVGCQ